MVVEDLLHGSKLLLHYQKKKRSKPKLAFQEVFCNISANLGSNYTFSNMIKIFPTCLFVLHTGC